MPRHGTAVAAAACFAVSAFISGTLASVSSVSSGFAPLGSSGEAAAMVREYFASEMEKCGWETDEGSSCRLAAFAALLERVPLDEAASVIVSSAATAQESCGTAAKEFTAAATAANPAAWLVDLSPSLYEPCEAGFVQGAWVGWMPDGFVHQGEEARSMFEVCALLPTSASHECAVGIGHRAPHGEGTFESAWPWCALVPDELQLRCVSGVLMEASRLQDESGGALVSPEEAFAELPEVCDSAAEFFPDAGLRSLREACLVGIVDVAAMSAWPPDRADTDVSEAGSLREGWDELAASCSAFKDWGLTKKCRQAVGGRLGWATSQSSDLRSVLCRESAQDELSRSCRSIAMASVV